MDILEFQGEYRWLSNFWPARVTLDDVTYPSVENAFQAAKTHPADRTPFVRCSAAEAKKIGRQIPVRSGWNDIRLTVMRNLIKQKFAPGTALASRLLRTGNVQIIEGNSWGDVFWGTCRGKGENHLGNLLMEHREFLQANQQTTSTESAA